MEVISLDEGRIVFNEKEVIKLTSESEKTCLVKASETLKTFSPFSFHYSAGNENYKIHLITSTLFLSNVSAITIRNINPLISC